jgi:hypothetical protein
MNDATYFASTLEINMIRHFLSRALLLIATITIIGCGSGNERRFKVLEVTPAFINLTAGMTMHFTAAAIYQQAGQNTDVTKTVTWTSSNIDAVTIDASGMVSAISPGAAMITATMQLGSGTVSGRAAVAVQAPPPPPSPPPPRTLSTIAIIPTSGQQTLYAVNQTAQFLAVGTFNTDPTTADVTDLVNWQSSDIDVATINASGLATAVDCSSGSTCMTNITASCTWDSTTSRCDTASTPAPPLIIGTSNLAITPSSGTFLPSLTVYPVGQGWNSASAIISSPVGINCTSASSGASCTADFVQGSTVTLTATASAGVVIGFSSNCVPIAATTSCTVTMSGNQTVGVIFNQ